MRSGRFAKWSCGAWVFALGLAVAVPGAEPKSTRQGIAFFENKIRPVLVTHCYECHSEAQGKSKGGLLLDTRAGMRQGGESGPAVVPGSPDDSLVIDALKHDGLQMPPEKKLPDQVVADFVTWVKMGAPDPREGGSAAAKPGKPAIDIEEGRKFWAFQPPKQPALPPVRATDWPRTDVDRFVLAGLEQQQLRPVGDADRPTLIRRLSFDLIGLPPTPEEISQFVADDSPRAVERLVDRLLASPHFGERWGRHWLDIARFAESNGNTDNVIYPHAWRYRDYVIRSFNADKPYDQFVREQLAGDLLPSNSDSQRDEQLVATGFLALGSKPRAQNNPDFQMDVVAEQIEVVTTGLMGLTVACARCHDHKFDPIPTTEYYALAGIFTSTQTLYSAGGGKGNGRLQKTGFHELTGDQPLADRKAEYEKSLASTKSQLASLKNELTTLGALNADGSAGIARNNKNKKNEKKANKNKKKAGAGPTGDEDLVERVQVPEGASPNVRAQVEKLRAELVKACQELERLESSPPVSDLLAMGVRDDTSPGDCALCIRGESEKRGDKVPRQFVSVATLGKMPAIPASQSGRLELAQWVASPENPLTSRVFVNRVWKHLFGRGLVPSVDNFGALGERPSHPELLDHLAVEFAADGWSVKRLIKRLVLTRAYGLSSSFDAASYEKDPDDVYLWRHAPRRLDAEALRDAMLAVSEQLVREPLEGSLVAKLGEQPVQDKKGGKSAPDGEKNRHRSVYLPILRNALPEALELFDAPDPSLVVGARDVTTVPSQSLYMMNSPFVVDQSRHFAEQIRQVAGSDEGRIDWAYRRALGRAPKAEERQRSVEFVERARASFGAAEKTPELADARTWAALAQALFASAEFRYVD